MGKKPPAQSSVREDHRCEGGWIVAGNMPKESPTECDARTRQIELEVHVSLRIGFLRRVRDRMWLIGLWIVACERLAGAGCNGVGWRGCA